MSILGNCPYCDGTISSRKITTKNTNVYSCSNAKKEYDESNAYVYTANSTCTFMIYQNSFLKWNKKSFSKYEMKKLLQEGQIKIRLHGKKGTKEYFKYLILDKEYGCTILWNEEVI